MTGPNMRVSAATILDVRRPVHVDLRDAERPHGVASFARDFAALGALFGVLYGWLWIGSALVA